MARRHLGYTIDDWEELNWWQQQVYLEGLGEEFFGHQYQPDEQELATAAGLGVNVLNI
jgi:hypothetical protein